MRRFLLLVPVFAIVFSLGVFASSPDEFSNSYYVTATDQQLGTVTFFIPNDRKADFGYNSAGYLVYMGSSSITCYCSDISYNQRINFSSWSTGTYQVREGTSWTQTETAQFIVVKTNLDIPEGNAPRFTMADLFPYIVILVGGLIVLCFMMRL